MQMETPQEKKLFTDIQEPPKTGFEILQAVIPEPLAELIFVHESNPEEAKIVYVANDGNISVAFQFSLPGVSWWVKGNREVELPLAFATPDNYQWPQWLRQRAFRIAEAKLTQDLKAKSKSKDVVIVEYCFGDVPRNTRYETTRRRVELELLKDADKKVSYHLQGNGTYKIFSDLLVFEFPFETASCFTSRRYVVPIMSLQPGQEIETIKAVRQGLMSFKFNPETMGLNNLAQGIHVLEEKLKSQEDNLNRLFDYWNRLFDYWRAYMKMVL